MEYKEPKFLDDRAAAKTRLPRQNGWYWWRASETSTPVRYYLQFEGRQATSEKGGTSPTSILRGEWGYAAEAPTGHS